MPACSFFYLYSWFGFMTRIRYVYNTGDSTLSGRYCEHGIPDSILLKNGQEKRIETSDRSMDENDRHSFGSRFHERMLYGGSLA